MKIGNGNTQPVQMEQTVQESSAAQDVQAAEAGPTKETGPELENMRDPARDRYDRGQVAEHHLMGSMMAAQLSSQLDAAKTREAVAQGEPAPTSGEIPIEPGDSFESKLAKYVVNNYRTARDYASALWDVIKSETKDQ